MLESYLCKIGIAVSISLVMLTAGCGPQNSHPAVSATGEADSQKKETRVVTDSLGRQVTIPKNVQRAAITNAYNAEIITAVGAVKQVAGVDYYIYQDQEGFRHQFTEDMVIGSGRGAFNYEKLARMNPQVLILCENDNWETAEQKLKPFGIPVVVCNAYYTQEFFDNVKLLGTIFNKEKEAKELSDDFSKPLEYVQNQLKSVPEKSVYFEYRNSGQTTIPGDYFYYMVKYAKGNNIFADAKSNHIQLEDVVKKNPQYIVKVSEPGVYSSYIPPTHEDMERIKNEMVSRPGWDSIQAVKDEHVLLLSHYAHGGASKLVGTMYLAKFMYPEYLPDLHPEEIFKKWVSKYEGLEYHTGHTYPAFRLEA